MLESIADFLFGSHGFIMAGPAIPFIPLIATAVGIGGSAVMANQQAKKQEGQMNAAKDAQNQQAAELQNQLQKKPQQKTPDNFLANKNKMLTNMRLGLASTITGAGGASSPSLSAPALSGTMGKTKLGA